jgi:Domain of unknown function (DUF1905)
MTLLINKKFTAKIEKRANFGWAFVTWPASVSYFGSTKAVKVSGTMEGCDFQTAFMPWGDGTQLLPVSAKLMKTMKKQIGDTVEVFLVNRVPPKSAKITLQK